MLGAGGPVEKTYIDQLFASNVYIGNGASSRTITTGIDISTEGGMTWLRDRGGNVGQMLFDTERGARKRLRPSGENNEVDPGAGNGHTGWTTTGFTLGTNNNTENWSNYKYINWNFRKAKGFFDIVKYTGNGTTGQYISHNLGCVPGCIIMKNYSTDGVGWGVYHLSSEIADEHGQGHGPDDYELALSSNGTASQQTQWMSSTAVPTATNFHLNKDNWLNNKNGESYVAYIFAAGRNTDATARCVHFDGSDDQLNISDHADFELGNGDFTLETWIKSTQPTNSYRTALGKWVDSGNNRSWMIRYASTDVADGKWSFFHSTDGSNYTTTVGGAVGDGKWHHIAVTRTGGNLKTFTDGVLNTTRSTSDTFYDGTGDVTIGDQGGNYFRGQLSNVRLVKGTALYTSDFTPPTEPLTNVTNTKLLCCNNVSVTGSTVTPGTITKSSYPAHIPESPFKDSGAQKFGEAKENVIHCGSYIGGGNTKRNIDLGWEPQWLLIKDTTTAANWILYDSIRGMTGKDVNDQTLFVNNDDAEEDDNYFQITPSGFIVNSNDLEVNKDNGRFIFIAIRRPDGYVGKPAAAGTDVLAMDTGASITTIPPGYYDSGFPVDFSFRKKTTGTSSWQTSARLIQGKAVWLDKSDDWMSSTGEMFDSNVGYGADGNDSTFQNWAWKRHAGFDFQTYKAMENVSSGVQFIPHCMNAVPEMIWTKNRDQNSKDWAVYHKGLNGGSNPHNYYIRLNSDNAEAASTTYFGAAPTSKAFAVDRSNSLTGTHDHTFLAVLFASVEGISKVGYFDGSDSAQTIEFGFQPRLLMVKCRTHGYSWYLLDTVRGIASGSNTDDEYLEFDATHGNYQHTFGAVTSSGFTFDGGQADSNDAGKSYIYYAHA